MKSLFSTFILALVVGAAATAQTGAKSAKPSPSLLSPKDSLWLTVDSAGDKILHHPVKSGQTLYSICRFYQISIPEIYQHNPIFQTDPTLRVGARVRVPIPNLAIKRYQTKGFARSQNVPIFYKVQPGETLYQICKRSFNMPVDTIKARNRMKNDQIAPGQLLFIAWMGIEGVHEAWRNRAIPTTDENKTAFVSQAKNFKEISASGVCFWQKDSNEKGDLYALHREAAIGTSVSVHNPMNKKTVFAKVIGRIPNNYERNLEVILSPAAARQIGARDPKFFVKTRYFK